MELLPPLEYPSAFNGHGRRMIHSRIAIWIPSRNTYQIYDVNREHWPVLELTPTNTERTNPFYFTQGICDSYSRNFTLHVPKARIHKYVVLGIWHTGGWLCRRRREYKEPVIPIMAVSDSSKLTWQGNIGLHECEEYRTWLSFQTPSYYRPILANRVLMRDTTEPTPTEPTLDPIPLFVAEALLMNAECPITMDIVEKGSAAVTSCFHVFQRDAIKKWLDTHQSCPVCKKTCVLTEC